MSISAVLDSTWLIQIQLYSKCCFIGLSNALKFQVKLWLSFIKVELVKRNNTDNTIEPYHLYFLFFSLANLLGLFLQSSVSFVSNLSVTDLKVA